MKFYEPLAKEIPMSEPSQHPRPQWAIDKQINVGDAIRVRCGIDYTFKITRFDRDGSAHGESRRYCPEDHGDDVTIVEIAQPTSRTENARALAQRCADLSEQNEKLRAELTEIRAALKPSPDLSLPQAARIIAARASDVDRFAAEHVQIRRALGAATGDALAPLVDANVLRLRESQALVARVRTKIGAAPRESTDDACDRLRRDAHAQPGESVREACSRHAGAALKLRACLDAVEKAIGFAPNSKPDDIRQAFDDARARITNALAPSSWGPGESLTEAVERFAADATRDAVAMAKTLRAAAEALGVPHTNDLSASIRRYRDVSRAESQRFVEADDTLRAAEKAIGCARGDLVAACARSKCLADRDDNAGVEGDLQRIRRALGVEDGVELLEGARRAGDALATIRDTFGVMSANPKTISIVAQDFRKGVAEIARCLGLGTSATFRVIGDELRLRDARAEAIRSALGFSSIGLDSETLHTKTIERIRELRAGSADLLSFRVALSLPPNATAMDCLAEIGRRAREAEDARVKRLFANEPARGSEIENLRARLREAWVIASAPQPEAPPLTITITIPPSARETKIIVRGLKNGGSVQTGAGE